MEIIIGLILLLVGGDTLVRGSVAVARKIGISELMIGLTLVGFGTSTPELVTSIQAALAGSPGIAVGNVVGSNIANILLILGAAALIYPIACQPAAIRRDGVVLILSALTCVVVSLLGHMNGWVGLLFIVLLGLYVVYTYLNERGSRQPSAEMHRAEVKIAEPWTEKLWVGLLLAIVGITLTIFGAQFLVSGAIELSRAWGISETTIGLTIVAVGTSLPELVTSVVAALKRKSDIALGNVIGSNIYNIWFILGATALVKPIDFPASIVVVDIWVMLAASFLLLIIALMRRSLSRWVGLGFIVLYALYVATMA
ncbi:calcium/sodium antiporter [Maritalea mediterranea]|uniref:Calcium/sodium antiporter n=1 Tax=Maritalea mediterranea TaxID=2909667 RepID=A0ABS9EBK2_9HYPH|nr:calcium/sodium antiporter [Maritalea mediterranea]MCF4099534.1 calcium/sodium antiporter [Maritalea mediterranea]